MGRILLAAFALLFHAVPVFAGETVTYEKDIRGIIAYTVHFVCSRSRGNARRRWTVRTG